MRRIRYRLRTLMILVAFVALVVTVVMQAVLLRRAAMREELSRAVAAQNLAMAELARARAEQAIRAILEEQATPDGATKEQTQGSGGKGRNGEQQNGLE